MPALPSSVKTPVDPSWVTDRLKSYGMFQDDQKAYDSYPRFKERVDNILHATRRSKVKDEEFQEARDALITYRDDNEDTILNELLPHVIKDRRTVPQAQRPPTMASNQLSQSDLTDDDEYQVKSYLSSGLKVISNREFLRTFLPFRDTAFQLDKKLLSAMAKVDGMTNPKPDRTYAVSTSACPFYEDIRIPEDIATFIEIVRGCCHPFCLLEGKSCAGDLSQARNQACRGGTCLVNCARLLRDTIGEHDVVGADHRTFCFSVTLSPIAIDIWVHWAEVINVDEGGTAVRFHMNQVASKAINDRESFGHLRRMLHNILDWGLGERLEELKALSGRIVAFVEKKTAAAKAAAEKAAMRAESANKKWRR